METWKDISGFEGMYQISDMGNVKSLRRSIKRTDGLVMQTKEKLLKTSDNGNGYLRVGLYKDGKHTFRNVHRLVAEAFIPNPDNLPQVDHVNRDSRDNSVKNLRWTSALTNSLNMERESGHAYISKTVRHKNGKTFRYYHVQMPLWNISTNRKSLEDALAYRDQILKEHNVELDEWVK